MEKQQERVQQQAEVELLDEGQVKQQALWANSINGGKGRDSCDIYDQLDKFEKRLDVELQDLEKLGVARPNKTNKKGPKDAFGKGNG